MSLLLQWYDNVSDEEAARRSKLDLSWKVALGIELMDVPFVKSVLCEFRNKLIIHKQLDCLVADCERTLLLAQRTLVGNAVQDSAEYTEIVKASTLLRRLLAQDVERTNTGAAKITQGVAQDRIVSVHDTEMRHGRKSVSQCFNGYKGALAVEVSSQIITAVDAIPANAHDSTDAQALIEQSAEKTGLTVTAAIGDGAYGTIDARLDAQEADAPYSLVAPVAESPRTARFTKEDFTLDIEHSEVCCPAAEVTRTYVGRTEKKRSGRTISYRSFRFSPKQCDPCVLRSQCIKQNTPYRSVLVHEHERLVAEARAFQRTDIFRIIYRERVTVEHRIARLMRFGARQARYFGSTKVLFQFAMAAVLANLTLMASHAQNGLFVFFACTLLIILALADRPRMTHSRFS